jgi:hypothetical protein
MTMNHYFAENVRKAREARLKLRLGGLNSWQTEGNLWKTEGAGEPLLRLKDILGVVMSNEDHTIQDLHDTLKSYYNFSSLLTWRYLPRRNPITAIMIFDPAEVYSNNWRH